MIALAHPMDSAIGKLVARRVARTAFGVVLIAGAAALVAATIHTRHVGAAAIILETWGAAFAAGAIAWVAARLFAHRYDRDAFARAGLVVPAIGVALLAPLTLQMPFVLGMFDEWVAISLIVTGPAHIAFALLSAWRARAIADGESPLRIRTIYLLVLFVSCVPFVILVLPPVLVALTGVFLLPVLHAPAWIAARERLVVDHTPPLAVAHVLSHGTR